VLISANEAQRTFSLACSEAIRQCALEGQKDPVMGRIPILNTCRLIAVVIMPNLSPVAEYSAVSDLWQVLL